MAYDKKIVMRPSLEQSLAAIFGNKKITQTQQKPLLTRPDSTLIRSAWEAYNKAQSALSQGNWTEYGRYQQELEEILRQLNQNTK